MNDRTAEFQKANDELIEALKALEAQRSECLTLAVKTLEEIAAKK